MSWAFRLVTVYTVAHVMTTGLARPAHGTDHISHKRLRRARISAIKQEILNKLGYDKVPDVSKFNTTVEEKRRMFKLYRKSLEEIQGRYHQLFEEEEYFAKQFHSFTDTGLLPAELGQDMWYTQNAIRTYFNMDIKVPDNPNREIHVHSATLKLYKAHVMPENFKDETQVDKVIRINVYQLLEKPRGYDIKPLKKLLDSKLVSLESTGWETLNVQSAVQHWVDHPTDNFGIEISSNTHIINDLVEFVTSDSEFNDNSTEENWAPTLTVYTRERSIVGRQKRSPEKFDCVQGQGERRCCRYPLSISFADIGWDDWVIGPEGFQAYFCDGSCPHRYKTAHNFANIKSLIHMANPAAAPAPCCSASRLSPLTLLHRDVNGHLVVSEYQDMIVQECKCS